MNGFSNFCGHSGLSKTKGTLFADFSIYFLFTMFLSLLFSGTIDVPSLYETKVHIYFCIR